MTYNQLVEKAMLLKDVEEGTSYGSHSVKRKGRFMFWFNPKVEAVAMKLDWESHDQLLSDYSGTFFKTEHYEGYPVVLVRVERLSEELGSEIARLSWADAPKKAVRRPR